MLFKNKKGETDKWSVTIVAIVAIVGLVVMFNGGLTGNVPAKVYDVSQGNVVGETEGVAGICKYVGQGKIACPGVPRVNAQVCIELASEAFVGDTDGILYMTQACIDELGPIDVSTAEAGLQADGTCGMAQIWSNMIYARLSRCLGTAPDLTTSFDETCIDGSWTIYMGHQADDGNPGGYLYQEASIRHRHGQRGHVQRSIIIDEDIPSDDSAILSVRGGLGGGVNREFC
ncbi:hypothetical protein ACFLZZ_01295 [Nanoarchaeota archaeon]